MAILHGEAGGIVSHIVVGSNVPPDMKEKVGFCVKKNGAFWKIFGKRYLRDYLELENNKKYLGLSTPRDLFISGVFSRRWSR